MDGILLVATGLELVMAFKPANELVSPVRVFMFVADVHATNVGMHKISNLRVSFGIA
jgi:hypothetical protein